MAYEFGAKEVVYRLFDPPQVAQLIRCGSPQQITLHQAQVEAWYNEILRSRGASIFLNAAIDDVQLIPELAKRHPRNHAIFAAGMTASFFTFQRRVIERGLCAIVGAPVPTVAWGEHVFCDLAGAAARDRLAECIFRFVDADKQDVLERAVTRNRQLKARAAALQRLGIREVRVTGGGNDLWVGFSDKARWLGGSLRTADGQHYHPNVPSFEVFSTPDRRCSEGRLVATRPIRLGSGLMVRDLVLKFDGGRVVDYQASEGADAFGRWLAVDDGARMLGEFALVGEDSPIAQTGLFFDYNTFDENAASHIALGQSISICFEGGEAMTAPELAAAGCNQSATHTDIPFGSPEVRVVAQTRQGEIVITEKGLWNYKTAELRGSAH